MKLRIPNWNKSVQRMVVLASLAACVGCGSSSDNQSAGDPALIGTWSGTMVGGDATAWSFTFTATTGDVKTAGVLTYQGTYTTDPSTTPKQIAISITSAGNSAYIGKVSNAIYQITGNKLSYAGNEPGVATKPTAFATSGGTVAFDLTKQ